MPIMCFLSTNYHRTVMAGVTFLLLCCIYDCEVLKDYYISLRWTFPWYFSFCRNSVLPSIYHLSHECTWTFQTIHYIIQQRILTDASCYIYDSYQASTSKKPSIPTWQWAVSTFTMYYYHISVPLYPSTSSVFTMYYYHISVPQCSSTSSVFYVGAASYLQMNSKRWKYG